MSDPHSTDPRYDNPPLSEPVVRRQENVGSMWGWVAGIAVLALIGFILVAGWNSSTNTTASNNPPPATTGSTPMRNVTPPASTTGSGSTSGYASTGSSRAGHSSARQ